MKPTITNKCIQSRTTTIAAQLEGRHYPINEWTNLPSHIPSTLARKLHLEPSLPPSVTRRLTESCFPGPTYKYPNDLSPIVSVHRNFDSLGFPIDHPGRSHTDTYYVNKDTVLRTPPRTRPTRSAWKLQTGSLFQPTCTGGM